MSQENVEVVQVLYLAANEGQLDRMADVVSSGAEFDWSRRQLDPMIVRGHGDVADTWAELNAPWESLSVEVEELVDLGERVLALVRVHGRGKGSGVEVDARVAHLHTLRDGRIIQMTYYGERSEALAAAGLSD